MPRFAISLISALILAFASVAWAGRGVPIEVTPEKMGDQGFSFECRFRDNTIKEGTKPTRRTGVLNVQVIFDAEKGPSVKKMIAASLVVREENEVILAVPVEWSAGERPGFIQFSLHERMLPNASIVLTGRGESNTADYTIPLLKFQPKP